MDHQDNSNSVASPVGGGGGGGSGGGGGYGNNNNNDNNGNGINHYQQRQASAVTQPSSGFRSVYLNTDYQQQQHYDDVQYLDLDNAFSRMSLYNGGSVFNNNNNGNGTVNGGGGGGGGDEWYNNRTLLGSGMNRGADLSINHANNTTSFYGSTSTYVQNSYGSSSSSSINNQLMDQYIGFSSMNTPIQPPIPPLPADPYRHLSESSALFFPPTNQLQFPNGSDFDSILSRTDPFFDRHQHFPQLERSYLNGRNRVRNNRMSMMMMDRTDHHTQFDDQYSASYNNNNISFNDLRGNLVNCAMDQHGCRILQHMFDKMGREEFNILFEELLSNTTQLMMDQYGNFIFQKLVQLCSVDQRTQIVIAITRYPFLLVDICLNSYGTRAVQKLLMYLTTREQKSMVAVAVSCRVFELSKDGNGHHVIVHCIKNFSYDLNQVFLDKLVQFCFELSTDQSGCCVVQSCVDHSRGEGRDRLVREILSVAHLLSEDRYGNYVVQCLLRQMDQTINMMVWEKLKGNFTSLSCNKFGSNVVEACLEQSDRRHIDLIISEMLENPHVSTLFSDPFGNYVTQVALSNSKGIVHEALVREVKKHISSLQSNQYGKMTLSWFDPRKRRRSMKNKN